MFLEKNDVFFWVVYTKNNEVYDVYRSETLAERTAKAIDGAAVKTPVNELPETARGDLK